MNSVSTPFITKLTPCNEKDHVHNQCKRVSDYNSDQIRDVYAMGKEDSEKRIQKLKNKVQALVRVIEMCEQFNTMILQKSTMQSVQMTQQKVNLMYKFGTSLPNVIAKYRDVRCEKCRGRMPQNGTHICVTDEDVNRLMLTKINESKLLEDRE